MPRLSLAVSHGDRLYFYLDGQPLARLEFRRRGDGFRVRVVAPLSLTILRAEAGHREVPAAGRPRGPLSHRLVTRPDRTPA